MSNLKKTILIFLLTISLVLLLTTFSSAAEEEVAERELEIEYPEIGGWRPTTIEKAFLPEYVKYIFNFGIAIAGLIAFGSLIYGGFRYITSAGAPTALTEAKDQIFAGVIGLAILLSSYLILTTINPQLVMLKKLEKPKWPELPTDLPGVYLIEKETEKATAFTQNVPDLSKYIPGQKTEKVRLVNPFVWDSETGKKKPGEYFYGAILFPETDYRGTPKICRSTGIIAGPCDVPARPLNSLVVFREVEKSDGEVTLCTEPEGGGYCKTYDKAESLQSLPDKLKNKVWSIKITGNYLLLLDGMVEKNIWKGTRSIEYTEQFQGPREWLDLTKKLINECGCSFVGEKPWYICEKSCATLFAIYPTKK